MKKITRLGLAGLLAAGLATANAESPFTVSPRVETTNGASVLRVAFAVPANHVLYADKLSFHLAGDARPAEFQLPAATIINDKFSGQAKNIFAQSFEACHALPSSRTTNVMLNVHFQGCDEANCYFPEDQTFAISPRGEVTLVEAPEDIASDSSPKEWNALAASFAVEARGSGYLNEKEFLGFLNQSQTGQPAGETTPTRRGFWGVTLTMLLIVLGGVALNLTPCILPMIPINLAIIGAGVQAGSKKRGFALGATYAAGMAIAYGALGLIVVLTGAKFGTLNSSPWFNLAIAAVFFILALAMFDLLAIDLSRFQNQSGGSTANKSKFIVAYTMGTVAALLAGACVAPVVISVLLQATALHAKGVMIGLLLPFLLGVGMGLPWPFAGAGLSFLPKPGMWMVRVKYGFGVLIVLFAAYYGYLSFGLFRSEAEWRVRARENGPAANSTEAFAADLTKALEASRADGKPVFLDFYASWCKNCSAMEHTTFASAAVKEQLAGYHEVRLQTERPNQSPAKEILDHFKVMGLPSYVILKPSTESAANVASHTK